MSATALVAYERSDGLYSLHHSHWGAAGMRLVEAVTPETPFGGSPDRDTAPARKALAAVQAGRDAGSLPPVDPAATLVNPAPAITGVARESLADRVDHDRTDAVYTVSPSLDVRGFLPVAYRPLADRHSGVLVALREPPARDAERLREWASGARAALGTVVSDDVMAGPVACSRLRELLADRAGDREVLTAEA